MNQKAMSLTLGSDMSNVPNNTLLWPAGSSGTLYNNLLLTKGLFTEFPLTIPDFF